MTSIVGQMFINSSILVSFLTFGNFFMREKGVNSTSPLSRKIIVGFVSGILGCLLMLYSVRITSEIIMDFRYIPIIIMAIYASWESAMVSALIIGIFRLVYIGINEASIIAIVVAIIIGIICSIISSLKIKSYVKWVSAIISVYILVGIAFSVLLIHSDILAEVLISYAIGIVIISFLMYFLSEYIEESNRSYRQLKADVKIDFLTGLNNVRQFDSLLNISISNAKERSESLSMIYMDLDLFKKVNDTYGHSEGDLVLKQLGAILKNSCRTFDIISRNGGEEFSVILLDCPLKRAVEVAERIRINVQHHNFVLSSGKKIKITVSIGVSSYPDTTADADKLVEQADIALYNAKRSGRNNVSVAK